MHANQTWRWFGPALLALGLVACFHIQDDGDLRHRAWTHHDRHDHARLAVQSKPVRVAPGETLRGDLVVVGGQALVEGEVTGNVVVIAGRLTVGPQAKIKGDLVAVGNHQNQVDPGATISGSRVLVNSTGVRWAVENTLFAMNHPELMTITGILGGLVLLLLIYFVIIRRYESERFHATVERRPLRTGLVGLLVMLLLHLLFVGAFASRYLIGLVPVVGLAIFLLAVVGWASTAVHVGQWMALHLGWRVSPFWQGAVGLCVSAALCALPIIGQLLGLVMTCVGLGALLAPLAMDTDPTAQAPVALPPDAAPDQEPAQGMAQATK